MSSTPWHKRYHSDAISGYMSLSLEERGAYTTLLDMMYDRGEGLFEEGNERLFAGYLNVSLRKYRSIRDALIAKGKLFRLDDGRLSNRRFEKEREISLKTTRKRSENAKRGVYKKVENEKKHNKNNDRQEHMPPPSRARVPDTRSHIEEKDNFVIPKEKPPRGTRLPEGWTPSMELFEWARAEFPHVNALLETEKFSDYWRAKTGQGATKLDWAATWRNWIRNATGKARAGPRDHGAELNAAFDHLKRVFSGGKS